MIIDDFQGKRILVVGDVMLDHFVRGAVRRVSPEAPALVLHIESEEWVMGGAANVALNVAELGGIAHLIGMVGDDPAAVIFSDLCRRTSRLVERTIGDAGWQTIQKTRFIATDRHLLRADKERIGLPEGAEARIVAAIRDEVLGCDAMVISDYSKGVVTDAVIATMIDEALRAGIPLIADPKRRGFAAYRGCTILTPNRKELHDATGMDADDDMTIAAAMMVAIEQFGGPILLTRSEQGMSLFLKDGGVHHEPASCHTVRDVSGAGDTVAAALALAMSAGAALPEAMSVANAAAGVAVGKSGTSIVSPAELINALLDDPDHGTRLTKLATRSDAAEVRQQWARQGLKVGFTNGCFDIIHPGHVKLLRAARATCDRLIVGLNTDASVSRLKGPERPVQTEGARADVIAALEPVDMVVLFGEDTPMDLITTVRPDVLVKGADYAVDQVVGGEFVMGYGGRVELIDLEPGQSTTRLIDRSRAGATD